MKLDLCYPCKVKLETAYDVKKLREEVNGKIVCAECGRRRFGGTYEVTKKAGKAGGQE